MVDWQHLSNIVRAIFIMSLTGGALTALLLLIKPLIRDRLPKSSQYNLWSVIIMALLVAVVAIAVLLGAGSKTEVEPFPFADLDAGEIQSFQLLLIPPDRSTNFSDRMTIDKLARLLKDVEILGSYEPSDSRGGQFVRFTLTMANGETKVIIPDGTEFVIDGQWYTCTYLPSEALNAFANSLPRVPETPTDGAGSSTENVPDNTFTNKELGITIVFPQQWTGLYGIVLEEDSVWENFPRGIEVYTVPRPNDTLLSGWVGSFIRFNREELDSLRADEQWENEVFGNIPKTIIYENDDNIVLFITPHDVQFDDETADVYNMISDGINNNECKINLGAQKGDTVIEK
jgi:hypothetical protein